MHDTRYPPWRIWRQEYRKNVENEKHAANDKNNEKDAVSLQNRTTSPGEGTCQQEE